MMKSKSNIRSRTSGFKHLDFRFLIDKLIEKQKWGRMDALHQSERQAEEAVAGAEKLEQLTQKTRQ